ncbi:cytochrome P450 [Mycena sanguinolenta]|nr:cytochrome P450 [Mycena sanguinolenta]
MDGFPLQPVALAAIALLCVVYLVRSRSVSRARRPPGPSGLPLLGNTLQAPARPVFLIGDIKLAKEILEKRSTKFSSRLNYPYLRHVDPDQVYWALSKQNENLFIARRLTTGLMAAVRAGETERLQQVSASMVLSAAFGLRCPTGQEPDLKEVVACNAEAVRLSHPTASIMNVLPFLDLIPGPMPWRQQARTFRKREDALYDKLITRAVSGEASSMNTWAAAFAREDKPEGDQRRLINQFTLAAIETTAVSMHTFILACILYPEWIPRAQREIDAIVGEDRLPSFKDRPHLPYVEAIVRETLRWRPAARCGVPHQSTADDVVEYKGKEYFIPKGSIIFPVSWAMEHAQERFGNPDLFQPERFLDDTNNLRVDYETSAFGFGRRVCPGIPFAERALWINVAMMLWTFNIHGSDEPDPKTGLPFKYDDSDLAFNGEARHEIVTNGPFEFPAVFEPRSVQRAEVARQEWAECEKDLNVLLPRHKEQ